MRPYTLTDNMTVIGMPPGIGDLHWIMTKFESFKKKNNIKKTKVIMNLGYLRIGSVHNCSIDYLKLIPFIDEAESVLPIIPFEYSLDGGSGTPLFKDHGGCDYMIEFNSLLEKGIPLKDILPEYEMNYDYPIQSSPESERFASAVRKEIGDKFILLFTGPWDGNQIWVRDLWTPADWMKLAEKIHSVTKCKPVLIGAHWDAEYAEKLLPLDIKGILHNLIGKTTVADLFALIRRADLLLGYQCGVVMMAMKFKTPVAGFWPIKNEANPEAPFKREFMRSWLPPWADEVGFEPFAWGDSNTTPDGVLSAIRRFL